MPNRPVSIENDVALQNNTTGEVDYLQFQGNILTASALFDVALRAGTSSAVPASAEALSQGQLNGRLFNAIAQQAPFLLTQWLTRSAQLAMR
jgi:hypothetical protein